MSESVYLPSPEGVLIRAFRLRADMTQNQLSSLVGRSKGYFGLVEAGHNRPSVETIRCVAKILNLTLAEGQQIEDARQRPFKIKTRVHSEAVTLTMNEATADD